MAASRCSAGPTHRFLATPHRVINRSGRERHAIPLFFDADHDAVMAPITSEGAPPQFMTGHQRANFHHAAEAHPEKIPLQGA